MAGEIQALFNKYQQKYPFYTKNAIIEAMLDDRVITYDIANKMKQGISLFFLDNSLLQKEKDKDISTTEIMGGYFNTTKKQKPKTNFNRKIEHTFQSEVQGDCWLLSDINALSYKDWGRKAIHDTIIPDKDGSGGGVTIRFKGSPLKQKEFHFTAEDIDKARKSGNYSDGDDDMVALELATEQTFKEMVRLGIAKRCSDDESLQRHKFQYRSFIDLGVETDEFLQYPISELLGIKTKEINFNVPEMKKYKNNMLKTISNLENDIAATCAFNFKYGGYGDHDSKDYIHGGHAYAIKNFKYGKEVILTDPYISDHEIKVPWQVFVENLESVNISCRNSNVEKSIQNLMPPNYKQCLKKYNEDLKQKHKKTWDKYYQEKEAKEVEEKRKQQQELAAKNAEKQREINNKKNNTIEMLNNAYKNNDKKELFMSVCKIDSDIVIDILEQFPTLIEKCDKAYSGWGNGRQKRYIISNIINSLCNKSKEVGIDSKIIENFKNKCGSELDAIIYTDEKVIQSEVEKMVKLIKSKL